MARKKQRKPLARNLFVLCCLSLAIVTVGFGVKILNTTTSIYHPQIASTTTPEITFPKGGETLAKGKTYTITWTGGKEGVALFVIDKATEKEGLSASIMDRVYNIQDRNSFSYTIPTSIPNGIYVLQIAGLTSTPFIISSH